MARHYRKITKKEVKEYAGIIAGLDSHEQFMEMLGLEKVHKQGRKRLAKPLWELRKKPRFKGYHDTWCRSRIGRLLDRLKKKYGLDVLECRRLALSGGKGLINEKYWDMLMTELSKFRPEHTGFILSGIEITRDRTFPGFIILTRSVGKGAR
ncbi:MAG: hypothetical protein ACYSPI_05875 [Planctomycetota bacterium]|jgi:hypothetical protein